MRQTLLAPRRRKLRWGRLFLAVLVLLGGLGVVRMARGHVPPAPARARAKPPLTNLPKAKVCLLRYAEQEMPGFAAAGGFTWPSWKMVTPGLLVQHPNGALLIDAGFSSHTREEAEELPFPRKQMFQGMFGDGKGMTFPPQALKQAGVEPSALKWLAFTHLHVDHFGGVVELPGVKVLLSPGELDFVKAHANQSQTVFLPAQVRAAQDRTEPLKFEPIPYETFPERADVFGDGSVVFVKLPGHTAGHVGAFVNLSESLRLFYVGDAVMHTVAVEQGLTKSLMFSVADLDKAQADLSVGELKAFHEAAPEVTLLPAHDGDAWDRVFGPNTPCIGG